MPDIFNTAVTGLLAFQKALAVTGNNITNSATPGYNRETVQLASVPGQADSEGYIGAGVNVTTVSRVVDGFATKQAQNANSTLSQQSAYLSVGNQLDNLLGGTTNGIASSLTSFFNSFQTLASDPSSTANRQAVLSQAGSLAATINQTSNQLVGINNNVNEQIRTSVQQVNTLAAGIASLNTNIIAATAQAGGQPPNTLLDQRDQLIGQLAQITNVSTNPESSGALDVFIGNGQPLVVGTNAATLGTRANVYDGSQLDITFGTGASAPAITSEVTGGSLGGLVQVTNQLLIPTLDQLGLIATGIASAVNSQQAQGIDQTGALGQPIFNQPQPVSLPAATNTGTALATTTFSNVSALTGDDYTLRWNGATWLATDAQTGQNIVPGGAASATGPLTLPGLTINVSAGVAANDSFLIEPTRTAAPVLSVILQNPSGIAAASPIVTGAAVSNLGNATISAPTVVNAQNPALATPVTIAFPTPATYTVNGGPAQPYVSGQTIPPAPPAGNNINGWQVTISGTPVAGDSFTVGPNQAGTGDNSNALALAALATGNVLANGTTSIPGGYASLIGVVGTQIQSTTQAQTAQQAIVNQATQNVSAISGVNLDEEGANLLQLQNAYTASAHVITTAENLFNTLISDIQAGNQALP
jgi:flagellar hook-associated protein 1